MLIDLFANDSFRSMVWPSASEAAVHFFEQMEMAELMYPSLKTIVHTLWNRIESQSVTRGSFDTCI